MLWCQAQERRPAWSGWRATSRAAAGRLTPCCDRASAALGEASLPVVSAANALGVVHKYASDFDAAEAAYRRASAAVPAAGRPGSAP